MNHFKVDVVCHGQTDLPLDNGCQDPYAVPKMMGKFISVDSGEISNRIYSLFSPTSDYIVTMNFAHFVSNQMLLFCMQAIP